MNLQYGYSIKSKPRHKCRRILLSMLMGRCTTKHNEYILHLWVTEYAVNGEAEINQHDTLLTHGSSFSAGILDIITSYCPFQRDKNPTNTSKWSSAITSGGNLENRNCCERYIQTTYTHTHTHTDDTHAQRKYTTIMCTHILQVAKIVGRDTGIRHIILSTLRMHRLKRWTHWAPTHDTWNRIRTHNWTNRQVVLSDSWRPTISKGL